MKLYKIVIIWIFLILNTTMLLSQSSFYSEYGKNRIQHKSLKWSIIYTDNFEIYYNNSGKNIADIASNHLENKFREITTSVGHQPIKKTKIFIFNSPNELIQSNIGINKKDIFLSTNLIQNNTIQFKIAFSENKNQFIETVTFHPSYSYEDFIEGIKPSMNKGKISYSLQDGIFKQICERASSDLGNSYVLLIDEINRGNVSKIFGELISILETGYRGDNVTLAYSKKPFNVPKNLHIIGTMNTADRSLVQIDTALRRRFSFIELMPKPELLTKTINGISLRLLLEKINDKIIKSGLREKQVGHTYFLNVKNIQDLQFVFSNQIIPLLQDYFFDDYKKLKKDILSEHFINDSKMSVKEDWKTDSKIFVNALKKTFGL